MDDEQDELDAFGEDDGEVFDHEFDPPPAPAEASPAGESDDEWRLEPESLGISDLTGEELDELIAHRAGFGEAKSANVLAVLAANRAAEASAEDEAQYDSERDLDMSQINSLSDAEFDAFIRRNASQEAWS